MQSPAERPIALAVRGLTKCFDRPAVDVLDLTIYGGEFYALVGPNGAGKTTTLRMVVGLLRPDAGSIDICGIDALADPEAAKQITAWLSDEPMIYDKLTPFEYLEFVAGLWRIDTKQAEARARELIGWLGLEPHAHERCEGFSKGMRQKVALAGALVHDPKLIILDEPLTGLDAGSARVVKNVLRERVAAGGTVIMTTHILEVAERMADRIGVIASGRLIAEGTLDELRRMTGRPRRAWRTPSSRWSRQDRCCSERPATLTWFASHELRLGWRDWVSLMTAGRRSRARTRRHRAASLFARLHARVRISGSSPVMPTPPSLLIPRHWSVITGTLVLSWALMLSQAMESVTRAFYARSDLDLILSSPVSARRSLRRAHRPHRRRRCAGRCAARRAVHRRAGAGAAARIGLPPMASSPAWARSATAIASRLPSRCSALIGAKRTRAGRADRRGGDRRRFRHRPAARRDLFLRQLSRFAASAVAVDAGARAGHATARSGGRLAPCSAIRARLPPSLRQASCCSPPGSHCSRAASATMPWPPPASRSAARAPAPLARLPPPLAGAALRQQGMDAAAARPLARVADADAASLSAAAGVPAVAQLPRRHRRLRPAGAGAGRWRPASLPAVSPGLRFPARTRPILSPPRRSRPAACCAPRSRR